ncbi:MAG: hypothetical protein NC113_03105 [Bacteroides sp.]|nr:hypothetical protein [Bacteroides sp.]MCM1447200.1 hypothetical protein [Bacteroides sp.]
MHIRQLLHGCVSRTYRGIDPTGIESINADGSSTRDVYYDLSGRRLGAPKKGLNIINGKKVIVR